MLKVGILGVGTIGKILATALDQRQIDAQLVAIADQDCERAKTLASQLASRPPVVSIEEMIDRSELAVEASRPRSQPSFLPPSPAGARCSS
jgi:aspartate dehydrogenase